MEVNEALYITQVFDELYHKTHDSIASLIEGEGRSIAVLEPIPSHLATGGLPD
jgi:hypothetical protein